MSAMLDLFTEHVVHIWAVCAVAGLLIAFWALAEVWSDDQLANRFRLNRVAKQATRGDLWQEAMFTVKMLTAVVLALIVLIPVQSWMPYIALGLTFRLVIDVLMALRRRLNRREMLRLVGLSRKSKDDPRTPEGVNAEGQSTREGGSR